MGKDDPPGYAEATCVEVPMEGLNPLIGLAALQINQEKEMLEAALNMVSIDYEGANKYKVRDPAGRPIYFIAEESGCCARQCCDPYHTMALHMTDMSGENVLTMKRPWTCNCAFCCLSCEFGNMCGCTHMEVFMGGKHDTDDEHKIGEVRMPCCGGGCTPVLNLQNKKGETKAVVKGPCCCVSDLCGANFEVQTPEGKSIGDVKKLGVQSVSDAVVEATTDADNFMISFPKDVNVEYKALMLSSLLLLDYMFFESEGAFQFEPWNCVCVFRCCMCYCCGCISPCSCNCPAKDAEDDKDKGAPIACDQPYHTKAAAPPVVVAEPVAI
jgi:hypothetical protein|mmetsp:Transcript_5872/g.18533  ORF Transcript_5872/g.18533 Transcript_5872/m.18533 type:complete len:326 (+) Transcript_5872:520-1497(+)